MRVRTRRFAVGAFVSLLALSTVAQESVNKELDNCIRTEQIQTTVKGAALGALAGLMAGAAARDNNKPKGKDVLVAAAIGGVAGLVTAYYKAVGTCYKKNPSWVPESRLQRSPDYEQAKVRAGYQPDMGPLAKTIRVDAPATVKAGSELPLTATFAAFMPDGSEADVKVERKLVLIQDGKENVVEFPGGASEQRKIESGEFQDLRKLPIPPDLPAGTVLKYEFGVSVAGKPVSAGVSQTQVN